MERPIYSPTKIEQKVSDRQRKVTRPHLLFDFPSPRKIEQKVPDRQRKVTRPHLLFDFPSLPHCAGGSGQGANPFHLPAGIAHTG
jgi:hypothetical protein